MINKNDVDNALKVIKVRDIANDGTVNAHIQVMEHLALEYFEMQREIDKLMDRKDWYKHEYYAGCDMIEELQMVLEKAAEKLEQMDWFVSICFERLFRRKPLSKYEWLDVIRKEADNEN